MIWTMDEEMVNSEFDPLMFEEADVSNNLGSELRGYLNEIESDGDELFEDDEVPPVFKDPRSLVSQPSLPARDVDGIPRFSNMVSPLVQPFRKMRGSFIYRRRKKSVKSLARVYCHHLMSFLSDDNDGFPQQALVIFEALLQSEMPANKERKDVAGLINLEDSPLQRTGSIYRFSGEAVRKLCDFLEASLKMLECITYICAVLNQALNDEGKILINTEEHKLCVLFVQRLFTLLERLDVLSKGAMTSFQQFLGCPLLHGILLLPDVTNFANLNSKILTNIFPSTMATIETLCLTSIGAVIRLSAFTCSMLSRQTLDGLESKLGNLANDVAISIQEFSKAVNSSREDYLSIKTSLSLQQQDSEPSSLSKFSREYKILKQYEDIHRLNNQLVERLATAQDLAKELINVQNDLVDEGDVAAELADRIVMEQSEASQIYEKLMNLMEIQNLLVRQLNSKSHHQLESGSDAILGNTELEMRTEVEERFSSERNKEAEEISRNEYECKGSEDLENTNTTENRDEVFIAIFSGEDYGCEGAKEYGSFDGDDKKLVKQSYSRLVSELKGSIEELLQNTKRRENEAQKTVYGNAKLDLDLIEDFDSDKSGARKELKVAGNLDSCLVNPDDPVRSCYPVSIVDELNARIKKRQPAVGLGSTDCIGDESSSESECSDSDS